MERQWDEAMRRIVALEKRVKQLEGKNAPTIPIYDKTNWPIDAVEGQVVIAPIV